MNTVTVSLVLICATLCCVQCGDERAACVIQCNPVTGEYGDLALAECPPQHECLLTGCGAMCFHTSHIVRSQDTRGACIMVCGDSINKTCGLGGYDCVSNGCGRECKLRDDYRQPEQCAPFTCDLHCMTGYYRDTQGCDHCQCAYTIIDKSG